MNTLLKKGVITNDILPNLTNGGYLTVINASLGYYNQKLDKKSSHLTTFAYQFGRSRYARLPFDTAPAEGMFQRTPDEIFLKELWHVFVITDDILVVGYDRDSTDHDETLYRVLEICRKFKTKHRLMLFQVYEHSFLLGHIQMYSATISMQIVWHLLLSMQKVLQYFLGIMNYLRKYSPATSEICKPFRILMLVKSK